MPTDTERGIGRMAPSAYACLWCGGTLYFADGPGVLVHADGHAYQATQWGQRDIIPEHLATPTPRMETLRWES